MAARKRQRSGDRLFTARWVHVFEEDTAEGAVYRPEDDQIPLSRRPRERLEIHADGSAQILTAGPDDRFVGKPATWKDEPHGLVIRAREGGQALRIVERSPSRLVIADERGSSDR